MENILREPLLNYLTEKTNPFANNKLAHKFRHDYPNALAELIDDDLRYKVVGSSGKGNWTDCPWIAIFDILVTDTAQKGYYPVFLFKKDMSGVYLSLNQGVTEIIRDYKKEAKQVLRLKAEDYRAKLNHKELIEEIFLESKTSNAKHYEAGNIVAKYYSFNNLPTKDSLKEDINEFLNYYDTITYLDNSFNIDDIEHFEEKKVRLHKRIERKSGLAKKVKEKKGYSCEACEMNFKDVYGKIGEKFIEAHHLQPISELEIGKFKINLIDDFAVLCSNCHSMIHRLENPSNLNKLKEILLKE